MSGGQNLARALEDLEFAAIDIDFNQVHPIDLTIPHIIVEGHPRNWLRRLACRRDCTPGQAHVGEAVEGYILFQYPECARSGAVGWTCLGPEIIVSRFLPKLSRRGGTKIDMQRDRLLVEANGRKSLGPLVETQWREGTRMPRLAA
jgi:hypothetical protein